MLLSQLLSSYDDPLTINLSKVYKPVTSNRFTFIRLLWDISYYKELWAMGLTRFLYFFSFFSRLNSNLISKMTVIARYELRTAKPARFGFRIRRNDGRQHHHVVLVWLYARNFISGHAFIIYQGESLQEKIFFATRRYNAWSINHQVILLILLLIYSIYKCT